MNNTRAVRTVRVDEDDTFENVKNATTKAKAKAKANHHT
jgi:hypothetical protein